jgi:hypothetical protein
MKKFGFDGIIADDAAIPRLREMNEFLLIEIMRDSGYVPVLDLDPIFYISYNESKDNYNFGIYMHGIYVGKKRSQEYHGYSGQRLVPRPNK